MLLRVGRKEAVVVWCCVHRLAQLRLQDAENGQVGDAHGDPGMQGHCQATLPQCRDVRHNAGVQSPIHGQPPPVEVNVAAHEGEIHGEHITAHLGFVVQVHRQDDREKNAFHRLVLLLTHLEMCRGHLEDLRPKHWVPCDHGVICAPREWVAPQEAAPRLIHPCRLQSSDSRFGIPWRLV